MRKLLIFSVLVTLCLMLVFTNVFASGKEKGEKAAVPGEITVPEEPVTLDFWFQDWAGGQKWLKDWEKVFEAKYPTIDVNLMFIPFEELQSKLIPSVSQGTEPTLMYCYVDWLSGLDTSKLFARLSPEIFTKEEWAERIYEPVLKSVYSSDGEIYVVPWVIGGSGWGIVYHNELLAEAGIDPETLDTWDDIKKAAKKLTVYNPDGTIKRSGILLNMAEISITYMDLVLSQGAGDKLYNKETGVWDFTIPESKNAMKLLKSFVDDEVFDPFAGDVMTAFPNRLGAMLGIGPWAAGMFNTAFEGLDVSPRPWPPYPGKKLAHISPQHGAFMVSKRAKGDEKNAAMIFIREAIENPTFFDIPLENGYWFGCPELKTYIDVLEKRIDGGTAHPNAVTAYNNAARGVPAIDADFMPRVVLTEIERTIVWPEIEKVFLGQQTIDDMMDYLSDYITRLEKEKM